MLAIRLQRLGRKKMPVYRLAVQESHRHPSSGRVIAYVGSYDPHTKATKLDQEKIDFYLKNGAQPSPRIIRLLENEKVAVPAWVQAASAKMRNTRNPEKLRKNQPKAEPAPVEAAASESAEEKPAE